MPHEPFPYRFPASARGFTLAELMFVVLIMSIIAVGVIPAMDNVSIMRQGAARDDVARMLEVARERAAASGRPHGLAVSLSDSTITIVRITTLGEIEDDPDPLTGKARMIDLDATYSGVGLSGMTNGDGTVGSGTLWFNYNGTPHSRASDGSFTAFNADEAVVTLSSGDSVAVHPYSGMVEER